MSIICSSLILFDLYLYHIVNNIEYYLLDKANSTKQKRQIRALLTVAYYFTPRNYMEVVPRTSYD